MYKILRMYAANMDMHVHLFPRWLLILIATCQLVIESLISIHS